MKIFKIAYISILYILFKFVFTQAIMSNQMSPDTNVWIKSQVNLASSFYSNNIPTNVFILTNDSFFTNLDVFTNEPGTSNWLWHEVLETTNFENGSNNIKVSVLEEDGSVITNEYYIKIDNGTLEITNLSYPSNIYWTRGDFDLFGTFETNGYSGVSNIVLYTNQVFYTNCFFSNNGEPTLTWFFTNISSNLFPNGSNNFLIVISNKTTPVGVFTNEFYLKIDNLDNSYSNGIEPNENVWLSRESGLAGYIFTNGLSEVNSVTVFTNNNIFFKNASFSNVGTNLVWYLTNIDTENFPNGQNGIKIIISNNTSPVYTLTNEYYIYVDNNDLVFSNYIYPETNSWQSGNINVYGYITTNGYSGISNITIYTNQNFFTNLLFTNNAEPSNYTWYFNNINSLDLSDGYNSVWMIARNNSIQGHYTTNTNYLKIDNTLPIPSQYIVPESTNWYQTIDDMNGIITENDAPLSEVLLKVNAGAYFSVNFSNNGSSYYWYTNNLTTNATCYFTNGSNFLSMSVTNVTVPTLGFISNYLILVDETDPVINSSLETYTDIWTSGTYLFSGRITENESPLSSVKLSVNNGTYFDVDFNLSNAYYLWSTNIVTSGTFTNGTNFLRVLATNSSIPTGYMTNEYLIRVDNSDPVHAAEIYPTNEHWNSSNTMFNGYIYDYETTITNIQMKINQNSYFDLVDQSNQGPTNFWSTNIFISLINQFTNGTNQVTLKAVNNSTPPLVSTSSYQILIDTTDPLLTSLDFPTANSWNANNFNLAGNILIGVSPISQKGLILNGTNHTYNTYKNNLSNYAWSNEVYSTNYSDGIYTIEFYLSNRAGKGFDTNFTLRVDNTDPVLTNIFVSNIEFDYADFHFFGNDDFYGSNTFSGISNFIISNYNPRSANLRTITNFSNVNNYTYTDMYSNIFQEFSIHATDHAGNKSTFSNIKFEYIIANFSSLYNLTNTNYNRRDFIDIKFTTNLVPGTVDDSSIFISEIDGTQTNKLNFLKITLTNDNSNVIIEPLEFPISQASTNVVTMSNTIRGVNGCTFVSNKFFKFVTYPPLDQTWFTLDPTNGNDGLSLDPTISITFGTNVKPETVHSLNFYLYPSPTDTVQNRISTIVSTNGAEVLLTLPEGIYLDPASNYSMVISSNVELINGQSLRSNIVINYATAPSFGYSIVNPKFRENNVSLSANIVVKFEAIIDNNTVNTTNFLFYKYNPTNTSDTTQLNGTISVVTNGTQTATTYTFDPDLSLTNSSSYRVVINENKLIQATNGDLLGRPVTWTFNTGEPIVPPSNFYPTNNQTGVELNPEILIEFDTFFTESELSREYIYLSNAANPDKKIIGEDQPRLYVSNLITYQNKIKFVPNTLDQGTTYYCVVSKNMQDNDDQSLASNFIWSFTTLPAMSEVYSLTPSENANNVALNTEISFLTPNALDTTTVNPVNIYIMQGNNRLSASPSYANEKVSISLGDSANFRLNHATTYQVHVSSNVKTTDGTSLPSNYTWSFTTANFMSNFTSISPGIDAKFVHPAASISAVFVEGLTVSTVNNNNVSLYEITSNRSTVDGTISYSASSKQIIFKPKETLNEDTIYEIIFHSNIITLNGRSFETDQSWYFRTGILVGKNGGDVITDDGLFSISFPENCFKKDTLIEIQKINLSEVPNKTGYTFLADKNYIILPDDTKFNKIASGRFRSSDQALVPAAIRNDKVTSKWIYIGGSIFNNELNFPMHAPGNYSFVPAPVSPDFTETNEIAVYPRVANIGDNVNISFQLPEKKDVTVKIYSLSSKFIKSINPLYTFQAGYNTVSWNTKNSFDRFVEKGLYIVVVVDEENTILYKKILLVKKDNEN